MHFRFSRQVVILPGQLGFNALVQDGSEKTSTTFSLKGATELALYCSLDYVAATSVSVSLDCSPTERNAATFTPDWFKQQTESVAAGVGTLSDYSSAKAVGAADKLFVLKFKNLNAALGRLRVTCANGTTDTLTITAIVTKG